MRAAAAALLLVACSAPAFHEPPGAASAALRPDDPASDDLFRFGATDVVEHYDSAGGRFRVHFTRAGQHRVPARDGDGNGTPDYVQSVAATADTVLEFYESLGFRAPPSDASLADNGGDGRFDVYLVDFGGRGDGNFQRDGCGGVPPACSGYLVQENDFAGYGYPTMLTGIRVVTSHELFHALQAGYAMESSSVVAEGTAVWATEKFSPALDDFEQFVDGYLTNPDRPLDQPLPGPTDPFSYGAAIFFQFLDERFGADVIRSLWEALATEPDWLAALDGVLRGAHGSSFAEAFAEFARWNLFTGPLADSTRAYARAGPYPDVKRRSVVAPAALPSLRLFRASTQYFELSPHGRDAMTAALVPASPDVPNTADLVLFLATRRDDRWSEIVELELEAGTGTIDTAGADAVVVAVVNTAREGGSVRPSLCIGTVEEVAACRESFAAAQVPDAGSGADAGISEETPDAGVIEEPAPGCGCDGAAGLPSMLGLLLALARPGRSRAPSSRQQREQRGGRS